MIRRGVLITLVCWLAFAVRASAEPPHQADIDACNKEAASGGPMPAASPDERKSGTTAQRETSATTDESASGAQHTMNAWRASGVCRVPGETRVLQGVLPLAGRVGAPLLNDALPGHHCRPGYARGRSLPRLPSVRICAVGPSEHSLTIRLVWPRTAAPRGHS